MVRLESWVLGEAVAVDVYTVDSTVVVCGVLGPVEDHQSAVWEFIGLLVGDSL